jgi:hypothetical protein
VVGGRDDVAPNEVSWTLIPIKLAGAASLMSATTIGPAPDALDVSHGRGAPKLALAFFFADVD